MAKQTVTRQYTASDIVAIDRDNPRLRDLGLRVQSEFSSKMDYSIYECVLHHQEGAVLVISLPSAIIEIEGTPRSVARAVESASKLYRGLHEIIREDTV